MPDILVFCVLGISHVQEDARGRDAKLGKNRLKNRTNFCCRFFYTGGIDRQLGFQTFVFLAAITLPESCDNGTEEFFALDILITERVGVF